jgi:hypothetical protein
MFPCSNELPTTKLVVVRQQLMPVAEKGNLDYH